MLRIFSARTLSVGLLVGALAACSETTKAPPLANADGCGERDGSAPMSLACTGLYSDWRNKSVAAENRGFAPGVELWSDGLDKQRFVFLPEGAPIDTSNPDEWRFPVGTKVWKEFSWRGIKVETRYFEKVREDKWTRATYVWQGEDEARREDNGVTVALEGLDHVVPNTNQCDLCHKGRADRLLGFETLGLAHPSATGVTLSVLEAEARLSQTIAAAATRVDDAVDAEARAAFAWMHVNCGVSCHNRSPNADALGSELFLRLDAEQVAGSATGYARLDPFRTTVGARAKAPRWSREPIVVPGRPEDSLLFRLANARGEDQMPPLGTKLASASGTELIRNWIGSMPRALERFTAEAVLPEADRSGGN